MRPQYDVIVAGAGPGGVAMAARLLKREASESERILVLERCRFPRLKPCGGGLTGHAEEAMAELGLALEVPHCSSVEARVRFGSFERTVELANPVSIIRREDFDADLVAQIRRRGVEVVEEEKLTGYEVEPDWVAVTTAKGRRLTTSVLVGADGAASVVRKRLSTNEDALPHRLFRMELALPSERRASLESSILYDFTPMTLGLRGYLWIFPIPGDLINVGVMHYPVCSLSGRRLVEILRQGLAAHGIKLPAKGTRGWPVWGYEPKRAISGPRILTVGDAAGVDALTGEGIAVAMEQAIVAGDAIDQAFRSGDFSFSDYRRRVRRATVGRELALDRRLAWLLYRRKRWRSWLSLVLFDEDILEMYAARIAGARVLADQKPQLFKALFRHFFRLRSRGRKLALASDAVPLALPEPRV